MPWSLSIIARRQSQSVRQLGLIAQDVQLILPEVVYETAEESGDRDAILGIDYVKLVPVLISAIRELNAKVANMERRIRR